MWMSTFPVRSSSGHSKLEQSSNTSKERPVRSVIKLIVNKSFQNFVLVLLSENEALI